MVSAFSTTLMLTAFWVHFLTLHLAGDCALDHPNYDPRGRHFFIYDPALFDISTASYVDVMRIMESIQQLHVDGVKNSFRAIFVVGDQQTYDRMCSLIVEHPERFRWCIPMNGDFHFVAHTVAAFHDLYFLPFSKWIVDKLGFDKVIKENDDNVTKWKQYDHFYQLITLAILKLVSESFDAAVLRYPMIILEQVKQHKGMRYTARSLTSLTSLTFPLF
jgi:hypothetical protein